MFLTMDGTSLILLPIVNILVTIFVTKLLMALNSWKPYQHASNVQNINEHPAPRIGGLGIYLSVAPTTLFIYSINIISFDLLQLIILIFAFLSLGFYEDLFASLGARKRLILLAFISIITVIHSDVYLHRLNISLIDDLLNEYGALSIALTALAYLVVSNAFNMVDGLNGLSGFTALLILCGIAVVCGYCALMDVQIVVVTFIFSIVGFLILNFPKGNVFLGDGGSYLIGSSIVFFTVFISTRSDAVSAWSFFLMCLYPLIEITFSLIRRAMAKQPLTSPDRKHLHHLIYVFLVRRYQGRLSKTAMNCCATLLIVPFSFATVVTAIWLWRDTWLLVAAVVLFSGLYVATYIYVYQDSARYGKN